MYNGERNFFREMDNTSQPHSSENRQAMVVLLVIFVVHLATDRRGTRVARGCGIYGTFISIKTILVDKIKIAR
jgi:hypothetical protein